MGMMGLFRMLAVPLLGVALLPAQVIEFESGGLRYKTLTRNGVTIMFASLPAQVREYSILQIAVLKTSDFRFERQDGTLLEPMNPRVVVNEMIEKAGRNDVIKLVGTYELGLYGLTRLQSTNGYEQRRQAAFAELTSSKVKAAAAASAIAFVDVKLKSGESTDGAIFYSTQGRPLGAGKLIVKAAGELFVLPSELPAP